MRWLYSLCFYLLLPLVLLRLLWRARRAPSYASRWPERFGIFSAPSFAKPVVWVHAVSVGETIAAAPLIENLLAKKNLQLVVTTMTPTGSAQVQKLFGERVFHVYAPYDLPSCVAGFLNRAKPTLLIIMETELWPNTIALCKRREIPVILANGRLSEKSARGYRKVAALTRPMLGELTCAAMQQQIDGERLVNLGLPPTNLIVTGNIKFDLTISDVIRNTATQLRQQCIAQQRLVWIAASTHKGEDEPVLAAFATLKAMHPNALLILVPRHPERFADVEQLCLARRYRVQKRSEMLALQSDTDILLGDTMGELLCFYGVADLAFVGGSLVPVGGHNLIEPAAWGIPIISGPHLFNFSEVSALLQAANAMAIVDDQTALDESLLLLAADQTKRTAMGSAAQAVAETNRGALARLMVVIENHLPAQ